jgi:sirohydrochlorin ferrochelatase
VSWSAELAERIRMWEAGEWVELITRVEEQVREAVDQARARYPAIEWVVVPRLGAEPDVARAVVARALETLAKVER